MAFLWFCLPHQSWGFHRMVCGDSHRKVFWIWIFCSNFPLESERREILAKSWRPGIPNSSNFFGNFNNINFPQNRWKQWKRKLSYATPGTCLIAPRVSLYQWAKTVRAFILSHFRYVWRFVPLWTVAFKAPLSMGFSRQDYWSGLPCLSPRDLHDPRIKLACPALQADSLPTEPPGKLDYEVVNTEIWRNYI